MALTKLNKTEYHSRRFSDFVRGEMARRKIRQTELAAYIGIDQSSISKKLMGRVVWTLPEMILVCGYLETEYTVRG